jgi:hypothetical protein
LEAGLDCGFKLRRRSRIIAGFGSFSLSYWLAVRCLIDIPAIFLLFMLGWAGYGRWFRVVEGENFKLFLLDFRHRAHSI